MKISLRTISMNIFIFFLLFWLADFIFGQILIRSKSDSLLQFASANQLDRKGLEAKNSPHRYLGYYPTPGYTKDLNKHNSLGYRGEEISLPKPDSCYRIVCLGGSTTYSNGVKDFRESYPYQLQEYLRSRGFPNVEVVNAGVGSWTSWESLINYQFRVLDLEPDLICIYHGINDVYARLVWPHEAYKSVNSGRRLPLVHERKSLASQMIGRSNLLRMLAIKLGKIQSPAGLNRIDPYPESALVFEFKRQWENGIYPRGIFSKISADSILSLNKPAYFRRNLENLVQLARGNNTQVILASFKCLKDKGNSMENAFFIGNALIEQNTILENIAAKSGALYYDYAADVPDDPGLFTDAIHMNAEGNKVKAKLFGEFIENFVLSSAEEVY